MRPPLQGERLSISGSVIGAQAELHVYDATESRIQFRSNRTVLTVRAVGGDHSIDLQTVPVVPHMFMNRPYHDLRVS